MEQAIACICAHDNTNQKRAQSDILSAGALAELRSILLTHSEF